MEQAADVFEVVVHQTSDGPSWFRRLFSLVTGPDASPSGVIISVQRRESGDEIFRHIEDAGDDEDHLLHGIEQDLASMTADEFVARWGS